MQIDIRKFIRDNWDDYKYEWPWVPKEGRAVPEFTPEVEIDILSRALIKAVAYLPDICNDIKDGGEYCPDCFQNDDNGCFECELYWLVGQGAEDCVRQMKKKMIAGVKKETE